jgi:translation elongation factor IF5A
MSDVEEFEKNDAGSSETTPSVAGSVKKGGYCMLKGFPCKVTEYSTAKPGKHGSAKATIVGLDIFTGKKVEDTAPTAATVQIPNVTKVEYEVADIAEDDFVSVILPDGDLKSDLKLPAEDEETYKELKRLWNEKGDKQVYFTIQSAVGQHKYVSGRWKE